MAIVQQTNGVDNARGKLGRHTRLAVDDAGNGLEADAGEGGDFAHGGGAGTRPWLLN